MSGGTVSAEEVGKFDRLASRWWDPNGPMKPLHRMNPARIGWIEGLLPGPSRILDVGCGAGLAAEALARHGHDVLGIDAAGEAIEAARAHAAGQGLQLTYRSCVAEDLVAEGLRFPVITVAGGDRARARPGGFRARAGGVARTWRAAGAVHAEPHKAVLDCRQSSAQNMCCGCCRSGRTTGKRSSRHRNWPACCGLRDCGSGRRPGCWLIR